MKKISIKKIYQLPNKITTLAILGTILTISLFMRNEYVSNTQQQINVQNFNANRFIDNNNLIIVTPGNFPVSFLKTTQEYYYLASYGRKSTAEENEMIKSKEDYLKYFGNMGNTPFHDVNTAKEYLDNELSTQKLIRNMIFSALLLVELLIIKVEKK